jgi:type IX secretion system PorP/SprF family membrane protein
MTKRLLFLTLLVIACSFQVKAQQDVHFSQFYYSPVGLNPAAAGVMKGDMRAVAVYRNQWASVSTPFTTISASFDAPIQSRKMEKNFLGVGLHFNRDKSGTTAFSNLDINGSISYSLDLGSRYQKPHYISFGLNAGYVNRSFNASNASWDSQWNGEVFDNTLPDGEIIRLGRVARGNVSVGAGALWNYAFDVKKRYYLGAAMFHFNRPNVSLFDEKTDKLYRKFAFTSGFEFGDKDRITTFKPNVVAVIQGPNNFINVGVDVNFDLTDRTDYTNYKNYKAFGLGLYHRMFDAIMASANFTYSDVKIGVAYDLNISRFNVATGGSGAFEIVLVYEPRANGSATSRNKLKRNKGL